MLHTEQPTSLNWHDLVSLDQLDELVARSHTRPVAIFKHSTRCGISAMAKFQLEHHWDLHPEEVDMYYLDLLTYRPVSNEIAERFGVWHQSPQLIVLRQGEVAYHTSHSAISVRNLRKALAA
ncbi:MAG: bacillithiol system redox-active protein YtxJ [Bacteroidetes bacterium]|nr:MAG: bacillithiol system redox-active protein YtxJ [Bacteroidota bacterium]